MTRDDMKDWIKKLCPEIAGWQVDLIVEQVDLAVAAERKACAKLCEDSLYCAAVIRSSDNKGIKWEVEP